jgi:hypothetical protein
MEKERVVEILISLVLVVLIFMIILISIGNENKSNSVISNSYNTYYYQENPSLQTKIIEDSKDHKQRTYYEKNNNYIEKNNYYKKHKDYYENRYHNKYFNYYENYKNYDSWGNHVKRADFNYYTDSYEVHITNHKHEGDYFTVKFYFENFDGDVTIYDIRKYIFPGDEETFYFRDTSKNKYEYYDWYYEVIN